MLPLIVLDQNVVQQKQLIETFERMIFASRFEKTIDLSDLNNITEQNVKNIYAWMINHLGPLSTYFQNPEPNAPSWFFQKEDGVWNKKIQMRVATIDLERIKTQANKLSNRLFEILKFLPNTNNQNDYIYWIYYFVSNWISYNKKGLDSKNIIGALLDKRGVCEAYAKLTQLLFNVIDVESVYQTGVLGSGTAKGPHIWNKFKINNNWFNIDTTSAATASNIHSLPSGDFLSFSDTDFSTKRTQNPNWYETKPTADFDTTSLSNLVPYRQDLPYKKVVYNNKWYYFDFNSREIIESDISGSNKSIIKKVNRPAIENYKLLDIVYLVGDKLYWIDKNEENKVVVSEYNLEAKTTNINYLIIDIPPNTDITETKLNINELKITTYNENGFQTLSYMLNPDYNFFNNQKTKFTIRSLSSALTFWFIQFDIGSNVGQFNNEQTYWKYLNILIKGLTAKEYNENLYNQLIDFKSSVESDLNKTTIPNFDIEIDTSKTIGEYDNLVIKPNITTENAINPQIAYQWQQRSDDGNWANIEGQINKDLTIDNITKEWNNKKVKVIMNINNNGDTHIINSNECLIIVAELNLPTINLSCSTNKTEWEVNDNIDFIFNFSLKQNLTNIKLYKEYNQTIIKIATISGEQNIANYVVKKEDLEKNIEFYIEADYFDRKVKSNVLTINFIPKFTQSINNENKTEINELDIDSEFTLSVNGITDGLTFQWNYDKNYFRLISNSPALNSITLKVIKKDNDSQAITCNIRRNSSDIKVVSYAITFKNASNMPLPSDSETPVKLNNLPIVVSSVFGILLLMIVIITIVVIIKKNNVN